MLVGAALELVKQVPVDDRDWARTCATMQGRRLLSDLNSMFEAQDGEHSSEELDGDLSSDEKDDEQTFSEDESAIETALCERPDDSDDSDAFCPDDSDDSARDVSVRICLLEEYRTKVETALCEPRRLLHDVPRHDRLPAANMLFEHLSWAETRTREQWGIPRGHVAHDASCKSSH